MDVRRVVFPFYIISKLFGYSFFDLHSVSGDEQGKCLEKSGSSCFASAARLRQQQGKSWKLCHGLAYVLIICINILLNLQQIITAKLFAKDSFSTVTGQLLSSGLFTCTGVMFILSVIHSICFRKEVGRMVRKFMQFDGIFEKHFGPIDHSRHRRAVIAFMAASVFLSLGLVPMSHVILDREAPALPLSLRFLIFGYVSTLNYAVLQSHTILSVSSVVVRIRALNKELQYILEGVRSAWPNRHQPGNVKNVQLCRILHDLLNDIVELINLCFTFHAMWCTLACFGFCLMSLYSDYEIITRKEKSWRFLCVNFAWNCFYFIFSTAIVWVASRLKKEANRTTSLVHKIINANSEPPLIDEVAGAHGVDWEILRVCSQKFRLNFKSSFSAANFLPATEPPNSSYFLWPL